MSVYSTEEEQIEGIKRWWRQNGKAVLLGLILGAGVLLGGRYWFSYQNREAAAASAQYQGVMQALQQHQADQVMRQGAALVDQSPGSPYASLASLIMAKVSLDQGKTDAAVTQLRWVIDHAKQQDLKHVARLRLAKLMIGSGKEADALALLGGADAGSFQPAYDELKGDIYARQGKTAAARDAYRAALAALPAGADRHYLTMKLDSLGTKDAS